MWLLFSLIRAPLALWWVLQTQSCEEQTLVSSHHKPQEEPAAKCHFNKLFTDVWWVTWFSCRQRMKVVKQNFQFRSLQQNIYLCFLAITAPPLAVQLAQISYPTACSDETVGGVNVVTLQRVQRPGDFFLQLMARVPSISFCFVL